MRIFFTLWVLLIIYCNSSTAQQDSTVSRTNVSPSEIAGLNLHYAGIPGPSPIIHLRCGATRVTSENEPLLIIDGVSAEMPGLSKLNPNDIESISILKDAQTSAIYGCRAGNGVIVITTKSAKVREFVIKDLLDGNRIASATLMFVHETNKKDTLYCIANDSAVVKTTKLIIGGEYKLVVTSAGYKPLAIKINTTVINKKTELLLERDRKICEEAIVVGYSSRRCIHCGCICRSIKTYNNEVIPENRIIHLQVFPNPLLRGSSMKIELKNKTQAMLKVNLIDINGKLIKSTGITDRESVARIQFETKPDWSAGIYIIQVIDQHGKLVEQSKIMIQ